MDEDKKEKKGYSYRTMWLLVTIWTIAMTWIFYITHEHLNWNGMLWGALLITYVVVLTPILSFSDMEWY